MRYNHQSEIDCYGITFDSETILHPKLEKNGDTISPTNQVPIVLGMANVKFERKETRPTSS